MISVKDKQNEFKVCDLQFDFLMNATTERMTSLLMIKITCCCAEIC